MYTFVVFLHRFLLYKTVEMEQKLLSEWKRIQNFQYRPRAVSDDEKVYYVFNEWNIKNRLWVLFLPKSKKFYDVHTIRRRFIHERLLRCREKVNREIKYLKCFPSLVKINLILMELENWEEESGHRSANRNIHQTSIRNETIAYQATLAKLRDG